MESVLISILSLLDDAECSSPANVDAGVQLRKDPKAYRENVRRDVELSKKDIPVGFVIPTFESSLLKSQQKDDLEKEDVDFWAESDGEDDPFGGSDSSDAGAADDDDDDDMEFLDDDDDEDEDETSS